MGSEAFPGFDSRGGDDREVKLLVIGREARIYLPESIDAANISELKQKLLRHLTDEQVDSVIVYCGNSPGNTLIDGILLDVLRHSLGSGKELILRGIPPDDTSNFQNSGWEIESYD